MTFKTTLVTNDSYMSSSQEMLTNRKRLIFINFYFSLFYHCKFHNFYCLKPAETRLKYRKITYRLCTRTSSLTSHKITWLGKTRKSSICSKATLRPTRTSSIESTRPPWTNNHARIDPKSWQIGFQTYQSRVQVQIELSSQGPEDSTPRRAIRCLTCPFREKMIMFSRPRCKISKLTSIWYTKHQT